MTTKQIIDLVFKDPSVKYDLAEFSTLGKKLDEILSIYPKVLKGKTKYFLKPLAPLHSEKEELQVYSEDGKSAPEELVRQFWVFKLMTKYGYTKADIKLEVPVTYGSDDNTRFADIVVYSSDGITPRILFEIKKPNRKDGIDQLKSYMESKGSPIAVWSNGGSDRVILYRPYPKDYDTLDEIPRRDQTIEDVIGRKRTLDDLESSFNFRKTLENIEELALANYGDGVFDEIFKLIFAKIYDEIEAEEREGNEILFAATKDYDITYANINKLFEEACNKWQGIFKPNEKIELKPSQLSLCIGQMSKVRLMGSNLRIMDDAFEYLIPSALKKKDGQFFTPRHVIDLCVRMLNPKAKEYIMDPSCGSAGFLLHAMDWVYPAKTSEAREQRKHKYAAKYLWGIDISEKSARTSRALMLIAGDGHTNIFGPRISSLDPTDWLDVWTGQQLMNSLRNEKLLKTMPDSTLVVKDPEDAWKYFDELKFDIVLANPPFAGEVPDKKTLIKYELAKPALKRAKDKKAKEERDVLFIERILRMLKPGGRAAIVLPQGKFNNSSLAFIREWIFRKARLLAVVGLHVNTFKPHTGTKTSVIVIQKYTSDELKAIDKIKNEVAASCPDYAKQIRDLIFEEIAIPLKKSDDVIGRRIVGDVLKTWIEDFVDEDTSEIVSIERTALLMTNGTLLTKENLNQIIENGIQKILVIKSDEDLSEEDIPENILELMIEEFEEQEPDPVEDVEENNSEEKKEKNDKKEEKEEPIEILTIDEKIEAANEKIDELHNSISYLSQKLKSYEVAVRDEIEAQRKEVIALENKMKDDKKKLAEEKKILKEKHKFAIRDLKNNQKESIRLDKAELKLLQKNLVKEKEDIMLLTNKGKLQLILEDYDKLQKLSDRYIDAQVAIKLDYPIFMAVSEEGGKDNSGEYVYVPDEDGNRVEDIDGNPIVKQDLVNYNISQEQLQKEFDKVPQNTWAIAEYFIKFAKEQNFKFWS